MRRILFLSTVGVFAAGVSMNAPMARAEEPEHKVAICHIPPGNPENVHIIVVDEHAVPAHMAEHGDYFPNPDNSCVVGIPG